MDRDGRPCRARSRSRTNDPAVPRTRRRLRRPTSVLPSHEGQPAPLCRLRSDVREARRRGARRPVDIHDRGRARHPRASSVPPARERSRDLPIGARRGRAGAPAAAAARLGQLAAREVGRGKGVSRWASSTTTICDGRRWRLSSATVRYRHSPISGLDRASTSFRWISCATTTTRRMASWRRSSST